MRKGTAIALCLLVLLVACAKKMPEASQTSDMQPSASASPSTDAEANNMEASVTEVDQLDQDLNTEYLDSLDEDLNSADSMEWD